MQNIYVLENGIGKHVIFSSFINDLSIKDEADLIIMSAYPQIFENHPAVEKSVMINEPGFYDEVIKNHPGNIIHTNPYYSNFVKGKTHIIEEWAQLLNLEWWARQPDIYVDKFAMDEAKRFLKENGDFIIVQFSGGQTPYEMNPRIPFYNHGQQRNYPYVYASKVIEMIKEEYPDMKIVNFCFENEPTYNLKGCIKINSSFMFFVALLALCKTYITIDSCLMHFAANKHFNSKPGVCIWGSTGPNLNGYPWNFNLSNTDEPSFRPLPSPLGDTYNKDRTLYIPKDEDSILVDPEEVVKFTKKAIEWNENSLDEIEEHFVIDKNINNDKEIVLNEKSQKMFAGIVTQVNSLNNSYQTLIQSHLAALGKEGNYELSNDGKKLIKVG